MWGIAFILFLPKVALGPSISGFLLVYIFLGESLQTLPVYGSYKAGSPRDPVLTVSGNATEEYFRQ